MILCILVSIVSCKKTSIQNILARLILIVVVLLLPVISESVERADNYVTVLLYHKFNEADSPTTSISTGLFEKQLRYLKDNNYNILTPYEFYDMLMGKRPIPPRSVLITIDDGYRSVYTEAYPILKKYRVPFLLFLYMEAVTRYPDFLTAEQIKEMVKDKNVFLGNHSYGHSRFARWPERFRTREQYVRWIEDDHEKSYKAFRSLTGHSPEFFAYPYGEYNREYYGIIKSSGYLMAFTQDPSPAGQKTDRYIIPRYALVGSWAEMDRFIEFLNTEPIEVRSCSPGFGLVKTDEVREVRFSINGIDDYSNLGIYISEAGWLEPVLDRQKGIVRVELKEKLKRRVNRIGLTGYNRRTGRWARFFYMIIKR